MMSIIIIVLSVFCNFSIVGDLGNPPLSNGYGKVDYDYEIMSYEVTNEEYCLFLNSVASSEDEYGLYSPIMSESFMGGIIQDFKDGELLYFVKKGYENKPVIGVTWYSAIRYINWLHYNAPQIEANNEIDLYTTNTEGDSYRGAYNTIDGSYLRNPGAIYWLPNRNEWIKAAFYWGDHWNESFVAEGSNCYSNQSGWAYPCPHIKDVGQNVDSSYYGLYDTRGNVAEWVEDRMGDFRLSLGGSLIRAERYGNINETEGDYPDKSISSFGFRVCRTANVADRLKEVQQFNSAKSHTTAGASSP